MHSLKQVAGVLGADTLPGIMLLIAGVAALCAWELRHITGGQAHGGRRRLIARLTALIGVVLGTMSCVLMAARFIWIA